jgi:hypothetical protein
LANGHIHIHSGGDVNMTFGNRPHTHSVRYIVAAYRPDQLERPHTAESNSKQRSDTKVPNDRHRIVMDFAKSAANLMAAFYLGLFSVSPASERTFPAVNRCEPRCSRGALQRWLSGNFSGNCANQTTKISVQY